MTKRLVLEAEKTRRTLTDLFEPIRDELAEAERIFQHELRSQFPFVQQLVDHCGDYQGKRLRPALLLLAGSACGTLTSAHPVLAAVVEMIHTATLVHDDVLDESMVRRHAATVNAEWGNETAVLLGDYLFTHAFHLAASLESTQACRWIGRATNRVCEGEMQQVHHRGNLELDERSYFAIIEGKTAELTAVSCRLGAHYAGADPATTEALDRYGRNLGIAFQISDDVLDIWGEERLTGKSLGTDIEKQKLTLPVIRLLETTDPATFARARRMLSEAKAECRKQLIPLLEDSGALDYSWQRARWHVKEAVLSLDCLADSPAKTALCILADFTVRRAS
ncbi:MAG: polyprenyl synthetase family protein [Isosphaeraceae bacterium]